MAQNIITSSFLVSNLHCPSCVSTIQDTLALLNPRPISVSPSLVSSWVTVQHQSSLLAADIRKSLENAGFDICDVAPDNVTGGTSHMGFDSESGYLDKVVNRLRSDRESPPRYARQSSRHIQNCEACRLEVNRKDGSSQSDDVKGKGKMDDKPLQLVLVESADSQDLWRATVAVGGMTCAACAGSITEAMEKKDWVKKVVVNLISNSATIDFVGEEHKEEIVEGIEDMGFEAAIDTVIDYKHLHAVSATGNVSRTVEILIEGMYCEHCPSRVNTAIKELGDKVKVEKNVAHQDPILKVTYTPKVPNFTVRDILATIQAADPGFNVSIYHPPTLEERSRRIHQREQFRILIRVLLTFIIAIPTLIIGIIFMSLVSNRVKNFIMQPLVAGVSRAQWALFIMATPVYFLCADVFHKRAWKDVRSMWRRGSTTPLLQRFYRFGSMNMLMSLGTSIAYWSSVAELIAAGVHPSLKPDNSLFYFDSVVFLTLFILIGRLIEAYSKSKTGDAVTMLGQLRPTEALLVVSNDELSDETLTGEEMVNGNRSEITKRVNVDQLEFGDVVKVLHGGSPPCDGIVVQGESKFDESSLTGESKLIKKNIADEVFSGTVNKDSPVSIKITGVGGFSMLDQIVKAVREGQTRRAPMERIADTLTSYFVPFVTLIAISTWIIWTALGTSGVLPDGYLEGSSQHWVAWALQFAISTFVVACPCGLALAAPTALFVGGGLAAKYGILVKGGGEAFEKASKLDCIVFDKTGTLTVGGEPVVTDSEAYVVDSVDEKRIFGMIKAVEGNSSHTVAKAIVSFCKFREVEEREVQNLEEIAGRGMKGSFQISTNQTISILIGNESLLSDNSVSIESGAQSVLDKWKSQGRSVALAAIKSINSENEKESYKLAAIFAISDPVRPEAPSIIQALRSRGTEVWMLSGDNQITANAIGSQIGIPAENVIAGVMPSQKAEKIQYLQKSLKARGRGGKETDKRAMVAMVGDGINDSPALTTADVGIAIGSGSDIAISSAEFVLVSSNLNSLITLLDLSRFVFRRIKFNFAWALVYNMIGLPVAAGVLYPIVSKGSHVRLDPVWASLAMAMSSVSVVCSSLALRSRIPGVGFKVQKVIELEDTEEEKT